ncbi:MAG: iron-sulfur cluster assembly scaffold protein [Isosphaeraceae bacterium]|nr:iron-sulfur cluster assembly scaffold protein [Isosphaeraceae bacterium]
MAGYSDTFMDHFTSPRNSGPMEAPDVVGHVGTPGRGPYFIIALRLGGSAVSEARFQTYGCGATIAAGSVLTEMVRQRPIAECLALTADDVIAALDGVPANKLHGPALAIQALRVALKDVVGSDPL